MEFRLTTLAKFFGVIVPIGAVLWFIVTGYRARATDSKRYQLYLIILGVLYTLLHVGMDIYYAKTPYTAFVDWARGVKDERAREKSVISTLPINETTTSPTPEQPQNLEETSNDKNLEVGVKDIDLNKPLPQKKDKPVNQDEVCPVAECPSNFSVDMLGTPSTTHVEALNVRTAPDISAERLFKAIHAAPFSVLATKNEWSFIRGTSTEGTRLFGWVSTRFVSPHIEGNPTSEQIYLRMLNGESAARASRPIESSQSNVSIGSGTIVTNRLLPTYKTANVLSSQLIESGYSIEDKPIAVVKVKFYREYDMSPFWTTRCQLTLYKDNGTKLETIISKLEDEGTPNEVTAILPVDLSDIPMLKSTSLSCLYRTPDSNSTTP